MEVLIIKFLVILLIVIAVIIILRIIRVIVDRTTKKMLAAEHEKRNSEAQAKVDALFKKYPLNTPIMVTLDLEYLNNNYSNLNDGFKTILDRNLSKGYLIRRPANDIYFSELKPYENFHNTPGMIIVLHNPDNVQLVEALEYFNTQS